MTPADVCPKCQHELAGPSETCPGCGFQPEPEPVEPAARAPKEPAGLGGLIEMDYTVANTDVKPELPQWRIELSRRFQEIKSRREGGTASVTEVVSPTPGLEPPPKDEVARLEAVQKAEPDPAALPPRPRRPRPVRPASRPEIKLAQQSPDRTPMPLFAPTPPAPARPVEPPPPEAATIQDMIDRAVALKAGNDPALTPSAPVCHKPGTPPFESRLILLSRTLAGLVDLIIVVFCAGAFVVAADSTSGIETLDGLSLAHYAALLLATYFLYSIFFLFTGNQTVGMMMTDLCVVDGEGVRPRMAHIVGRCLWYLVSLLGAGIGLLWGCFDKEARCMHDRFSGTRIVRLAR